MKTKEDNPVRHTGGCIISIILFIWFTGYGIPMLMARERKISIEDMPHYTIYPNKKAGITITPTFGTQDSARVEYFPNGF